jgi:hypothetical protein
LPQVGLEDALAITLGVLDREPATFSRFAARWGRGSCWSANLSSTTRSSRSRHWPRWMVASRAGIEALAELTDAAGPRGGERLLVTWLDRRGDETSTDIRA